MEPIEMSLYITVKGLDRDETYTNKLDILGNFRTPGIFPQNNSMDI
jgi:hypothetical protein